MTNRNWYAALGGVAAAAVALGVAEVVGVFVSARATPLVAVGGVVIDASPEPVKEFAIRLFGTHDKLALLIGTGVLLAVAAGLIGMAALRSRWFGPAGAALFAAIGAGAAVSRAGASAAWTLPSLVGGAAGALALWLLPSVLAQAPGERQLAADDRRRFLTITAVAVVGAAVASLLSRLLAQRRGVETARSAVELPTPSGRPALAPAAADVAGLSYTTGNTVFYRIDTALIAPQVDPAGWRLRIHGRVGRQLVLTFDDLLRRPMIERYVTLACVSNEVGGDLIGNARWLGVPVKDLLDEAGPEPGADQVVSRSVDGFTAGTPTAVLTDGRDAMIAVGMNGEPLPVQHGFPARLVVPGLYGYVSATKWLAELELTSFTDFDAYWVRKGWAPQAPIKTQSRIDVPRTGAQLTSGIIVVAGVAWAQHRGISGVEVRVGDGAWQPATLAATVSVDTWRLWSWRWEARPGQYRLQVRATDNAGEVQTQVSAPPFPDGATGWHTIEVSVV